jgi:nucleoside-diphosphate-sugar epimerase
MATPKTIFFIAKTSYVMKIFITGATGYIGNLLALKLASSGHSVHALVRNSASVRNLDHPNINLFQGDINDVGSINRAMEGCDHVFHLAAFARLWAKPSDIFFKVNVEGTRNVLAAALGLNIARFVHTSSTAVFGTSINHPLSENDPRTIGFSNDYDLSKCMAEKLVLEYAAKGLSALIVNPSRVYGPGNETYSNPITRFLKTLLAGKFIPIPKCPDVVANYSYVHDVVEGHILAINLGQAGERYILGGENVSYRELFMVVREIIPGRKAIPIPKIILKVAGAMQVLQFYLTRKQPAFTPSAIDRYFCNTAFSCQKAVAELNYKITPFRDGMLSTIHHLKQVNNETR